MYQAIQFGNYYPTLGELVNRGVPIFNNWWNTYIPEHRKELEQKIIHTYYFNQIGCETPERFIYYINSQLERIMPYYNQLYQSELIKIDPLLNHAIEVNGRNIENVVASVNTSDDKISKSVRDFVGLKDTTGHVNTDSKENKITDSAGQSRTQYNKDVVEHTDDVNVGDTVENQKTHSVEDMSDTQTRHVNGTTISDDTKDTDKTVTETPGQVTTKEMEWGQTEKGKKNVKGNVSADETGSKNWTETRDDDSTTDTTTHLDEHSSGSSEKDYADTPQIKLDVNNETGTAQVRKDYLTNVTWNNESSQHVADTTQKQVFKDDETKVHNEDTTNKKVTDNEEATDTTTEKGGKDTETTTLSGKNVTVTEQHEVGHGDVKNTSDENGTDKKNTVTDTTKDTTSHDTDNRDIDRTMNEIGTSTTNKEEHVTGQTTGNVESTNTSTEQARENAEVAQSSTESQEKKTEETRDEGTTNITKGFMNVSSSALLNAFRDTFINIDNMIIAELRDNFMMVY